MLRALNPPVFEAFDGFGASRLAPEGVPPANEITFPADDRRSRKLVRTQCPVSPGVYGMIDAEDELIYVGKSKVLRDRLLSYFSAPQSGSKARRIIERTRRVVWEPAPHEFTALVRELELIRRFEPRYNVRGRPGRRGKAYLCLGRGPAPYAYRAGKPSARAEQVFGPVPAGNASHRWVRLVNDCFQLRDCPQRMKPAFADQLEMFPRAGQPECLRRDLGTCLGPCAGGCSSGEYGRQVRAAADFLGGRDTSILDRLDKAMRTAAAGHHFERAAYTRDTREELARLNDHLERLREARRDYSFVYPLPGYRNGQSWYLIRAGQIVAATPAPRGRRAAQRCMELLRGVYPAEPCPLAKQAPEDLDEVLLVASWFRQYPDEMARTLSPADAEHVCTGARAS